MPVDSKELQRLAESLADRYAIEREVGHGGMATVYLARDLKHDRRVAVKVLHPDLAAALGAERFLAEIRTTANLQHPHILPLHDSGDASGYLFYVMPYVEGETLRQRIEREQQLPIEDAVRLTREVLSALDYAHRHGVIHRDIKPENVLLHDGSALVADFGIALAVQSASGARMTQTGLSLGTPSYMSPEQAMGEKSIDGRADIYAVGAMLYEMLTGEPPFSGATVQAIVAKVITERPTPPSTVRDTVPPGVEAAALKALAKLPADRFGTAAQFSDALTQTPSVAIAASGARVRLRTSRVMTAALTASMLALTAMSFLAWRWHRPPELPRVAFEISTNLPATGMQVEPSPDGSRIATIVQTDSAGGQRQIEIRDVGSTTLRVIPGTGGVTVLNWSLDGREIIYGTSRQIFRVAASEGGVPRLVTTDSVIGIYGDPTWGADDQILFSDGGHVALVSAAGGKVRHIFADSLKLPLQVTPRFLPDGKRFLFTTGYQSNTRGVWVGTLDGARPTQILTVFSKAMVANGLLFYSRDGALVEQPFDEKKGSPIGEPRRVADDVVASPTAGEASWSISRGGTLAFRRGSAVTRTQLHWLDRAGKGAESVGEPMSAGEMNLSPDGHSIAISMALSGLSDVWVMNLQTRILSRVTSDSVSNSPIWMPDSRTLVYQHRGNNINSFRKRLVGGASDTSIYDGDAHANFVDDVSPDGKTLTYHQSGQLFALPLDGGAPVMKLARPSITEARFSPDGKWVSFGSRETGSPEVYAASWPKFDRILRVSAAGGVQGRWRGDSRELLYLTPDGKVMSAPVNTQSADPFGAPVELFKSPLLAPSIGNDEWNVTRDAQRFLFLAPADAKQDNRRPITVIMNWRPGDQ